MDIVVEFLSTSIGVAEICHKHGIAPTTFDKWRKRFMDAGGRELAGIGGSGRSDPAKAMASPGAARGTQGQAAPGAFAHPTGAIRGACCGACRPKADDAACAGTHKNGAMAADTRDLKFQPERRDTRAWTRRSS